MTYDDSQKAYCQSVGTSSTNYSHIDIRNPTSNDTNYNIGKFWQNTANQSLWYLNSKTSFAGILQAVWVEVSNGLQSIVFDADSGSATPSLGILNIFGSTGITTSASGNTVTITSNATLTWSSISSSQSLVADNGYFVVAPGAAVSLNLPGSSSVGDIIVVTLDGATSFTIAQSAGQTIRMGNRVTTSGAGGSIASNDQGDTLYMVCQTANLQWNVINSMGNLTIV